ncbi:hypothetical protein KCTC52924_01842 [Arenibacter antarcticus]|uniref:Arsenate reductase family protein n=1 Tax=Arenibacter antarcticus TaxID=2040469 RepID=A0ABW5VJM4_9FLAO|nr:hypothetical protein [Arenibacter sp. H213]MCM4166987.1 hypothetical protein [Arenibacter sp. H213]
MEEIVKDERKLTLYYHSGTSIGKQTYAYATTSDKKLLAIDIAKTKVTGTQWAQIADHLGIRICDLINMKHPDFIAEYGTDQVDLGWEDCLKILDKNPITLAHPILMFGATWILIKTPSKIASYLGADTVAIKKIEEDSGE